MRIVTFKKKLVPYNDLNVLVKDFNEKSDLGQNKGHRMYNTCQTKFNL